MNVRSSDQALGVPPGAAAPGKPPAEGMVWIPGGTFVMGSNDHYPEVYGAYAISDKFAATFRDFPPIQKPNTFTIDGALAMMRSASAGG